MAKFRGWPARHMKLVLFVGLPALYVGWFLTAYPRGMLMAYADTACGHCEILSAGKPVPWSREFRRILHERCGVEIRRVADCSVGMEVGWYMDGYNGVSRPRIRAKFGADIFREADEAGRAAWLLAHPPERPLASQFQSP